MLGYVHFPSKVTTFKTMHSRGMPRFIGEIDSRPPWWQNLFGECFPRILFSCWTFSPFSLPFWRAYGSLSLPSSSISIYLRYYLFFLLSFSFLDGCPWHARLETIEEGNEKRPLITPYRLIIESTYPIALHPFFPWRRRKRHPTSGYKRTDDDHSARR